MDAFALAVQNSWLFTVAMAFIALYPLVASLLWIVTALIFRVHREDADDERFYEIPDAELPSVTVLVPAFNEARHLDESLESLHDLDYPDYQVLVVDDASTDSTTEIADRHVARDPRFRRLRKEVNEGKSMAMNHGMRLVDTEVVIVVDADSTIAPDALRYICAHFARLPRVGSVTGNPRVVNRVNLLTEMQVVEFSSIVSLLRRAQHVWGRILAISGVISAFRVSALKDVDMFDPKRLTEDIDVAWKLQMRFYDVRYEPRALVSMNVPSTMRGLWRQRVRWAGGLAQVLAAHGSLLFHWKNRRQWGVVIEAILSVIWAHAFVVVIALWILFAVTGAPTTAFPALPSAWGMMLATASFLQLIVGVALDLRYDRQAGWAIAVAPLYPFLYWMTMTAVTVRSTTPALIALMRGKQAVWSTPREPALDASPA